MLLFELFRGRGLSLAVSANLVRWHYAPKIIAELKAAKMIVVEGTLYPILTRQKNQGLLTYRWEESPQGPPRKYYSLSEEGRRTLAQLDESWEELVEQVRAIRHGDRNITAVEPIE